MVIANLLPLRLNCIYCNCG